MALSDLFRYGAQPNLLLIITDQERSLAQWPEPYRAKLGARLKAMRRLAGHGLSFDRAYTGACMCTPSRATFLTSQYPAVTGCTTTGADSLPLPDVLPNLATVAQAAGYGCYWIGKWHLLGGNEPGSSPNDLSRWGFSDWDPNDAGLSLGPTYLGGGTLATAPPSPGAPNQNDQRYLADALKFLAAPPPSPYCLVVSLVNPHDSHLGFLDLAATYYDATVYGASGASVPANAGEDLAGKPRAQASYAWSAMAATGAQQQDFVDFYAYLLEYVDSQILQLLDAMSREQIDNTLIVRFADHGELGLSHGLVEKFVNAYDEALHVPLLFSNPIAWPRPQRSQCLASSVDLLPTLASLLGVADQFPDLVGRDLSPALADPEASVQDEVHFTYDDIGGAGPSTIRAIRSEQWTYAVYLPPEDQPDQGGDWELYDHRTDPQQDRNLAGDPAYRDQQLLLERALVAQMQAKGTLPTNWPPAYVPGRSRGGPA